MITFFIDGNREGEMWKLQKRRNVEITKILLGLPQWY